MFFYKKIKSDGTLDSLQSCSQDVSACDTDLIPISETEFDEISAEILAKAEEEKLSVDEISAEEFMSLLEGAL